MSERLAGREFQLIRSKPRRYRVPEECTIFFQSKKPFYSFPQETHKQIISSLFPGIRDNDRCVLYQDRYQRLGSGPPGYWSRLCNRFSSLYCSTLPKGNAGSTNYTGVVPDVLSESCLSIRSPEIYPSRLFRQAEILTSFYFLSGHGYRFPDVRYYNHHTE